MNARSLATVNLSHKKRTRKQREKDMELVLRLDERQMREAVFKSNQTLGLPRRAQV